MEPTDQPDQQPTPVPDDAHATSAQLLARAATDYATGWGCPDVRATSKDRVHGQQPSGAR